MEEILKSIIDNFHYREKTNNNRVRKDYNASSVCTFC